MAAFDLLSIVQPEGGWFAIIGISTTGRPVQILVDTREAADEEIAKYLKKGLNVFFGVAKFATDRNRQKDNVLALKALWMDIDCGPTKALPNPEKGGKIEGYASQVEAIHALKDFVSVHGLPKPIIVNSGRGLHVYWPFDRDVTREEWEPVAHALRDKALAHGLIVDPSVFEAARVLRVPGTLNFKQDPPLPVEVMYEGKTTSWDALCAALGVAVPTAGAPPARRRGLTALGQAMKDNSENSFAKIMRRSEKGTGCAQLKSCVDDRATLSEPRWFNALSIASACVDKDEAVAAVSEDHPNYDFEAAMAKTAHIGGPHSCVVFEQNNPGGCAGCPHLGQIKSPIVLGKMVQHAQPPYDDPEDVEGGEGAHAGPEPPFPFFRAPTGAIFYKVGDDEEKADELVCPHNLYVVKRMNDPDYGFVALVKVHLPLDGMREFRIPMGEFSDPRQLKTTLLKEGVPVDDKKFGLLAGYLKASIENLKKEKKADVMRTQFGWADNDSKFIIGSREITRDGEFYTSPSNKTREIAVHLSAQGDLEKWKEVFALYGRPGMEAQAFAALTAFGAPLLKFTGHQGAAINLIHQQSGTGKTTVLRMCNSVWGDPIRLCAVAEDTLNAKIMRLGVMNNLPLALDEVTNLSAADVSTLVYNISQGRGKDRVKQNANEMRANNTSWQTIALCSSNSSFYQKMAVAKGSADAEQMRIIEIRIEFNDAIEREFAREMFDHQLPKNYGHAGLLYADYLVRELETAKGILLDIQHRVETKVQLEQRERFWSAVVAANLAGGAIAKELGLIDWNLKRIFQWACKMIVGLREDVTAPLDTPASILGEFLNRNMQQTLVVNDKTDLRLKLAPLPLREPKGNTLAVRYEPDTKLMYIPVSVFAAYCDESKIVMKEALASIKKEGALKVGTPTKHMGKGMSGGGPVAPVRCYVFDCSNKSFLDVDALVLPSPPIPASTPAPPPVLATVLKVPSDARGTG